MADMTAAVVVMLKDKLSGTPIGKVISAFRKLKSASDSVNRSSSGKGLGRQFSDAEVRARKLRMELGKLGRAYGKIKSAGGTLFKRGLFAAGGILMAKGAAALTVAEQLLGPAAQFEQYRLVLETLEGSAGKAEKSFAWVKNFAKTTPYEVGQVMEAFIKLRGYGLDPTSGLLKTLGDSSSAMGKDLMQSVEAISDAMMGENERLKEAFNIKARVKGNKVTYSYTGADGKTQQATADLRDQASVVKTLVGILGRFDGAMDKQSKGWNGMISNLMDARTSFLDLVANSGPFELLKGQLKSVLDQIDAADKNGTTKQLAERWGGGLAEGLKNALEVAKTALKVVVTIAQTMDKIATSVGGWENLTYLLVGAWSGGKIVQGVKGLRDFGLALNGIAGALGAGGVLTSGLAGLKSLFAGAATAQGGAALSGAALLWAGKQALQRFMAGDPRQAPAKSNSEAMARLEEYKAKLADLDKQIADIRRKSVMPEMADTLTQPLEYERAQLYNAIAGLERDLASANTESGNLRTSLTSLMGLVIAPQVNIASILNALRVAQNLKATLSSTGASPAAPSVVSPGHDGARALGGSVYGGRSYLVGERGPEIITPKRYGHVKPISAAKTSPVVNIHGGIHVHGNADQNTLAKLAQMLTEKLRAGLHDGAYA